MPDARETIADLLKTSGVTCSFAHVPTGFDPKSKEWQCVAWRVIVASPRGKFETDYQQGVGHLENFPKQYNHKMSVDEASAIDRTLRTGKLWATGSNFGGKPIAQPSAADVIGSLLSDARAADYATFEEWAREVGDNPDSRKADATFNACRQIALDLNRVLGASVVEQLRPLAAEL